jgi:hypothetical protein
VELAVSTPHKLVMITPDQFLLVDPNAYANLCLLFPCDDPANPPALTLPPNFRLVLTGPREAVLLSKSPPAIFRFDPKTLEWVPMQTDK